MADIFLTGSEYIYYAKKYKDSFQILPQDKGSKLRPYVTVESGLVGEGAVAANQVGVTEVNKVTTKNADSPINEITRDRRWYQPEIFDWGYLFDEIDKVRTLGDPGNAYAVAAKKAFGRNEDDLIIENFFGTNKTGQKGEIEKNFDRNNIVSADDTGLTTDKLIKAQQILLANEIDLDDENPVCVITAKQSADLLRDAEYTNIQYGKPILEKGKLKRWLGIDFIHKEKLPFDSTTSVRSIPVFVKSCMALGEWKGLVVKFAENPNKSFMPYLYMRYTIGATRLDEKGCVEIQCKEA